MYKFIESDLDPQNLDKKPFKFSHKLRNHPALSLENLSKVLVNLPKGQVMYSKGLDDLNANFDRAHIDQKNGLTIEETIENIRTSDSYIMVRSPEVDPSFKELYQDLIHDVEIVMNEKGVGNKAIEPMLFLFIASPNAFTPFHIDRYSTFLFQIRGSKQVAVFDQFDDGVVPAETRESFADYGPLRPGWSESIDNRAHKFQFSPGEALHIPFIAGHYIKNGPEDVSISMSIIFRTKQSKVWLDAMSVNNRLRTKAKMSVVPVGKLDKKDKLKALLFPAINVLSILKNALRNK
ncbi:cupin-like domain-containing protein [Aliikangiella maris]|uniref:Cupin-like domain-containing protein n=1 Tax=Aliikangiella maris TaxID=3162458 RepID=A0ABV3MN41_9GAMM